MLADASHALNGGRRERLRATRSFPNVHSRALVVNCSVDFESANHKTKVFYNLGAEKLADYLEATGFVVDRAVGDPGMYVGGYDLVAVSAIFSWHAPVAADVAVRSQLAGAEVWAGGTAFSNKFLRQRFSAETGITPVFQPEPRFEKQRAGRKYVYAVRGCAGETLPNGAHRACTGCPVPIIEGKSYALDRHFVPAPTLLDNNLSGMPVWMQEFIIRRYRETGTRLIDAASGFEPGHFDEAVRARWEPILAGSWRWGFDNIGEFANASRMAAILADVRPRRKQVYAMCGNEPIETCYERAQKVIEWGCEPHVQYMIPLSAWNRYEPETWLDPTHRRDFARSGWTIQQGRDFSRYYIGKFWRAMPIWDYRPRVGEPPPFAFLKPRLSVSVA